MWKEILKAAGFAKAAHKGQTRGHGAPYFEHPKAVARILWDQGYKHLALIKAAYLHDTIEDCGVTEKQIAEMFGELTAYYVAAVTKPPGMDRLTYYRCVKRLGNGAVNLKLADSLHNSSELTLLPPTHPIVQKHNDKVALMLRVFASKDY